MTPDPRKSFGYKRPPARVPGGTVREEGAGGRGRSPLDILDIPDILGYHLISWISWLSLVDIPDTDTDTGNDNIPILRLILIRIY